MIEKNCYRIIYLFILLNIFNNYFYIKWVEFLFQCFIHWIFIGMFEIWFLLYNSTVNWWLMCKHLEKGLDSLPIHKQWIGQNFARKWVNISYCNLCESDIIWFFAKCHLSWKRYHYASWQIVTCSKHYAAFNVMSIAAYLNIIYSINC